MSFLKLNIDEIPKSTTKSKDVKSLKQEILKTIPKFELIQDDIFKDGANIFSYKQKGSKNTLFWTINGCPYFYNHIPKPKEQKGDQKGEQKGEQKGKKRKKEEKKEDQIEITLCPNLILVLEYPDLIG